MAHFTVQRDDRHKFAKGTRMGSGRCEETAIPVLNDPRFGWQWRIGRKDSNEYMTSHDNRHPKYRTGYSMVPK